MKKRGIMNTRVTDEPKIKVGVLQGHKKIKGIFNGSFRIQDRLLIDRQFSALVDEGSIVLSDINGNEIARQKEIR